MHRPGPTTRSQSSLTPRTGVLAPPKTTPITRRYSESPNYLDIVNSAHVINRLHAEMKMKPKVTPKSSKGSAKKINLATISPETLSETLQELNEVRYLNSTKGLKRPVEEIKKLAHTDDLALLHDFEVELARNEFKKNVEELNAKYSTFKDVLKKIKRLKKD
ncbi:unnamed protein product [Brachionus calyciflorus]|uniref:Uncharacterized protein n=1 Tax=Brachionus calyciflorus TaxID=104777 RepID=A0A813YFH9_9BILA|nr:unnamed protein product [Brachionus calyciflorus]